MRELNKHNYFTGKHSIHFTELLTTMVLSFIKQIVRKDAGMTIYSIYEKNHPVTSKQVVTVVDLGYLGIEKDYPNPLSSHYHAKRKETSKGYLRKKKSTTKIILKLENMLKNTTKIL